MYLVTRLTGGLTIMSLLPQSGNSSRRNLFTPNSTRRHSSNQSSGNFYGSAFSSTDAADVDGDEPWQPGEYIVTPRAEPPQPDIQALLSQMQSAISAQIQKVQTSVDNLSGRVDRLEDNMSDTAEQLQLYQASLSSSSSTTDSEDSISRQRQRRVAPDKSVSVYLN